MPEIKNTFTQGKMNKDLDERLVPNGQYRDAMNVQISTSDSSDVGAIENILGNAPLMAGTELDNESYCVGSVADEKNDAVYWLIAGPVYLGLTQELSRDMIVQYKGGVATPVIVDIYRIRTLYGGHDSATNTIQVTTQNDPNTSFIEVGMFVQFDDAFNQVCYFGNNPITNIVTDPATGVLGQIYYNLTDSALKICITASTATPTAAVWASVSGDVESVSASTADKRKGIAVVCLLYTSPSPRDS